MAIFGNDDGDGTLGYEPRGETVTQKRIDKLGGVLEPDERVEFVTAGTTIDVEGAGSGSSLFGNDRSRKTGTRGYVRAAFTDERVAVKIPQWTGSDERTIPYRNVLGIDLDTGLVKNRISIQTPGPTYHIEVDKPGKDECRELVRYVRDRVESEQQDGSDDADPTEQLQRVKELHDDGVLSESEYEEKRAELLDRI